MVCTSACRREPASAACPSRRASSQAEPVEAGGLRQRLTFRSDGTSAAALIAAVAERVAVRDLAVAEPAIEDVVRQLYSR